MKRRAYVSFVGYVYIHTQNNGSRRLRVAYQLIFLDEIGHDVLSLVDGLRSAAATCQMDPVTAAVSCEGSAGSPTLAWRSRSSHVGPRLMLLMHLLIKSALGPGSID